MRKGVTKEVDMQNVIVGYDGSDEAKRALDRAAALARAGAKVTVVGAVGVELHAGRSMGRRDSGEANEVSASLEDAQAHLKAQGVESQSIEGEGDAGDVIIEAAKESGADLVIVGTRGRGGAKRLFGGSVSTKVVHEAPCDVLVVR